MSHMFGGQSSPSPDFPQPIHVVTGENTIEVQGKNLIPGEVFEFCTITNTGEKTQDSTRICTDFIELDPAKSYFLSSSINYGFSGIAFYNNTYTYISRLYWSNSKRHTIATTDIPNNTKYVKVFGQIANDVIASTSEFEKNEWYLEEGDSNNTKYVPYYHADYPINLGSLELCKIGDYSDTFENQDGKWYKNKRINKRIFNSNSGFRMWDGEKGAGRFYIDNIWTQNYPRDLGYMTHFKREIYPGSLFNISDGAFSIQVSNHRLWMIHLSTPTLTEWGNWLSENPVTFYYILQAPILEEITDSTLISQLDEIYEHLQLVKGTNNITVTAEDLAPYMKLSYMQDIKSKLDNLDSRLALLE